MRSAIDLNVKAVVPIRHSLDMFFGRCKRKGERSMSLDQMDKAISKAVISNDGLAK